MIMHVVNNRLVDFDEPITLICMERVSWVVSVVSSKVSGNWDSLDHVSTVRPYSDRHTSVSLFSPRYKPIRERHDFSFVLIVTVIKHEVKWTGSTVHWEVQNSSNVCFGFLLFWHVNRRIKPLYIINYIRFHFYKI